MKLSELLTAEEKDRLQKAVDVVEKKERVKRKRRRQSIPKDKRRFMNR